MIVGDVVLAGISFEEGWAVRPKHGGTIGENTVQNYLTDNGRCYELGNRERGKKMSGAQMRSTLELKYSRLYDIPTEQHITNATNSLNQAKTKRQELAEN